MGYEITLNEKPDTRTSPPIRRFLGAAAKMGLATFSVFLTGAYAVKMTLKELPFERN